MPDERKRKSVLRQLASLQAMPDKELKEKWRDLYGTEPPGCGGLYLRRQLAYRIQELFYGGLAEEAKAVARKIAESPKPSKSKSGVLAGTRFIRQWKGHEYVVTARDDGFELNGQLFSSLSAVATHITGTKWNGLKFFALK